MADVFEDVRVELARARAKFPVFNSAHEGWAVIDEEATELKNEVYWGPTQRSPWLFDADAHTETRVEKMRNEAVQLAAMAIRFIEDICDQPARTNTGEPNA